MFNHLKTRCLSLVKILIRCGLIVINDGFICLPVKPNVIVFESFNGKNINDNPAAIYDRLIKEYPEMVKTCYFSVKPAYYEQLHRQYPQIKLLKRFMPKWIWYMARAQYWIFNSRLPAWWIKNNGTTYLQTWHGTPLKKLGVDITNVEMPGTNTAKYHRRFINETKRWDYLIAPNQYAKDIFQHAFQFHQTFLDIGYPRNDCLYQSNHPTQIKQIKQRLLGHSDGLVIMYAPTWRDDDYIKKGQYRFELPFNLNHFFEHVPKDTTLILRPHYLVKDHIDIRGFEDRVKILAEDDISLLYLISDLLITDYSSVMFDYANLKRPMLFYAYDLDHYQDQLRGFYFNYEAEIPGPLATDEQHLNLWLDKFSQNGNWVEYQNKMQRFYDKYCGWETGHSAEDVIQILRRNQNG